MRRGEVLLILCSNGLSSDHLRMEVREHMFHCRSAALVVTPSNDWKKQDRSIPRCTEELESLGLSVTLFDIDEQPEITAKLGIMSIPTLIAYRGGKPIDQFSGILSRRTILSMFK